MSQVTLHIKSIALAFSLTALLIVGAGCSAEEILLKTADYKISGLDNEQETKEYLEKILNERLEPKTKDDDDELNKRNEDYRERVVETSLIKALHAKGYYDAKIEYQDSPEDLKGIYKIKEGALYTISKIAIAPKDHRQHLGALTVAAGSPLEAKPVLKSQVEFYQAIQKDECYFNLDVSHKVVLNKKNKTAKVIYDVDAGPKSIFDDVVFKGQETVDVSYLEKLIPFKDGDCFRREKLEKFRERLLETNLFARAKISLPETPIDGKKVPVTVDLKERAHRTVRLGASFYTDEGPGVTAGWEHRNIFGSGEKLEAEIKASLRQQLIGADFTKPFFMRKDQSLTFSAALNREDSDAFDELSIGTGISINRSFNKRLNGSTGIELKFTRIDDKTTLEKENFGLISFPNALNYDSRDNRLNPSKGWQIRGVAEPFLDVLGNSNPFFKNRLTASTYFGFGENKNTVFALRGSVGSISGADIDDIPASERFYAGGGGSIRGFGYQEVGPIENGEPSGGASIVETSAELRFKFTDTIGAVGFVDAGNVNESSAPSTSNMSVGAGVGLRYYTSFGPLRLDIATPLTNKELTDSDYQIYISIGQAF